MATIIGGAAFAVHSYGLENDRLDHPLSLSSPLSSLAAFISTSSTGEMIVLPAAIACEQDTDDTSMYNAQQRYSEVDAFQQCLAFHRSLLSEYNHRWDYQTSKTPTSTGWPRNIPSIDDVPALEMDLVYCNRSPKSKNVKTYRDDLQFRIAACYITETDDEVLQKKGFQLIKDLAERGHADGMCYYGIIVNDGRVPGVQSNPILATVWWGKCVDMHNHVPSIYELAVALYTGEGVPEDEILALDYFRRAANTGHAPGAYMLGDCLLDGIGCEPDRAEALDWLVTAAELGHRGARSRVLALLSQSDNEDFGRFTDSSRQSFVVGLDVHKHNDDNDTGEREEDKWGGGRDEGMEGSTTRPVSIERKYTIGGGGGSRNPVALARRKTLVEESRTL